MRLVAMLLGFALVVPPLASGAAPPLQSPFTALVRRDMQHGAPGSGTCAAAPPVQSDVFGVSYYVDALHHSIADPALLKKNVEQLKPGRDYLAAVTRMTDAAVQGSAADGDCAFGWLRAWAVAGGFAGNVNRQGEYEREWTLCGLALAYLKLRDTGRFAAAPGRAEVEGWLAHLARIVQPISEKEVELNNHAYWTGLGVAAAGVAANDRKRFEWGLSKYDLGASAVLADGTLPLEMKRGRRALHYHFFALTPLVFLAELGEANGLDLYARNGSAVKRLEARSLAGARDPSWFGTRSGEVQDIVTGGPLSTDEIAWMEPYGARFGSSGFEDILARYRPLDYPRLGGNLTAVYAGQAP
jgi:poly(beta-D-mannuronate) lyase